MLQISLKAARVNAGLTQVQSAKLLGISVQTLINWERSPWLIPAYRQRDLSKVYRISIDSINFLPTD